MTDDKQSNQSPLREGQTIPKMQSRTIVPADKRGQAIPPKQPRPQTTEIQKGQLIPPMQQRPQATVSPQASSDSGNKGGSEKK